jgi:RNA polymerase sigma factor (TIGR02999 family)
VTTPTVGSLIASAELGDKSVGERLFSRLYDELHRLAKRQIARHGAALALGPTTLLHEAYFALSEKDSGEFPDRARFMGYASRAMRGLIIDFARKRYAQKRGGQFLITSLEQQDLEGLPDVTELDQISLELDELASVDPKLSEVVDLKFFCGFSFAEIAALRGVSESSVRRDWEKARIYLHRALQSG